MFSRLSWWLVDSATRLLGRDEREVVRGDLAESGESAGKALIDVLGLVIRRQANCWTIWQPWFALVSVVAPLGMLFSLVSRQWADGTSVTIWLYLRQGFLPDSATWVGRMLLNNTALICWAWTCGYTIGSLSRRAVLGNGLLFSVILFSGTIGSSTTMRNDARVFTSVFYSLALPILVRIFLVALPAIHGMRRALRVEQLGVMPAVMWTVAIAAITVFEANNIEGSASFFGWRPIGPLPDPGFDGRIGTDDDIINWKLRFLPFVVMWPAVYMLAISIRQRLGTNDHQRRAR
jgi:hypothetical protein